MGMAEKTSLQVGGRRSPPGGGGGGGAHDDHGETEKKQEKKKEMPLYVRLSDGRDVDLRTVDGATNFLLREGFSSLVRACEEIVEEEKDDDESRFRLDSSYKKVAAVADNVAVGFFNQFNEKQVEVWFVHAARVLGDLSHLSPEWHALGELVDHELQVLRTTLAMLKHPTSILVAGRLRFFEALAAFIASAMPVPDRLPEDEIAECFCRIVDQTRTTFLGIEHHHERVYRFLEKTNLLVQFLRCSAKLPTRDPGTAWIGVYDDLLMCPVLLRERFCKHEPCGDAARLMLMEDEEDPAQAEGQIKVLDSIYGILSLQEFLGSSSGESRRTTPVGYDRHFLTNYCETKYIDIMCEICRFCRTNGAEPKEVLVEFDFLPTREHPIAPALAPRPRLKIGEIRRYLDLDRSDLPDWFGWGATEEAEGAKRRFVAEIQDYSDLITPNHLVCAVRYPTKCCVYGCRMQRKSLGKDLELFSEACFKAFRSALDEDDYRPMLQLLPAADTKMIRTCIWEFHKEADVRLRPDEYGLMAKHLGELEGV